MEPMFRGELSPRLSKRLANFNLSDDVVSNIAERIIVDGLQIINFDPCIYGICIDYVSYKLPDLSQLINQEFKIAKIEMFPWGIYDPDIFLTRVAFTVDELEGKVAYRGFER